MSDVDAVSTPANAEPKQYVAEFVGGPSDGTTEHRYLTDGKPQERVTQMATVEYVEGLYWYTAGETREVGGVTHVRYLFDEASSDETEGTADQQAESRQL